MSVELGFRIPIIRAIRIELYSGFHKKKITQIPNFTSIALSSAEAPAGYPHQNINNRKNRKRAGDVPRALSFSFSPASPQHESLPTIQRGLCGGESKYRGFTSNSLVERRGTRYLSLHLVVI